jgi:outer membrane lipoprotein-sorting protein
LVLVVSLFSAAVAEETASRLDAVLGDLSKRLGAVKTLRARFEQKKWLEVFEDEVTSEGTLALAAPDKLRWEYARPLRSALVVDGRRALREKTSRRGETTRRAFALEDEPITAITAEQVFLWTRGDFARAREGYELSLVSDKPLVVRAAPKDSRVRDVVSSIELTFSDDRKALTGVTLVEKNKARTVVSFRDVEIDPALPDGLFRVEK